MLRRYNTYQRHDRSDEPASKLRSTPDVYRDNREGGMAREGVLSVVFARALSTCYIDRDLSCVRRIDHPEGASLCGPGSGLRTNDCA